MPRQPRIVIPDIAHHCTQRGTNREQVFFTHADRRVYMTLLSENAAPAGAKVLAYCLMANHVHHIVVPSHPESLSLLFRRTHGRYAQYLNAKRHRTGHLWQNRFFSCALAGDHLWTALRYVERNPVRAGLCSSPESYRWSSAAAHLGGRDLTGVVDLNWMNDQGGPARWAALLAEPEELLAVRMLQHHTYAGRPLLPAEFQTRLESILGRQLPPSLRLLHSSAANNW